MNLSKLKNKGFTLIEILVVIAILAVLAVVVFVALDPSTRLADARDSRRTTATQNLLTAVHECIVDNDGVLATCGLSTPLAVSQLGTCTSGGDILCTTAGAVCLDLSTQLSSYLLTLPIDPLNGSAVTTGYSITVNADDIVSIDACAAEGSTAITASR